MSTELHTAALPILSYHTGAGWAEHGRATSPAGAKRQIMRLLSDASLNLVRRHGFELVVAERTALQRELNGGPKGYVWSIGKRCGQAAPK